MTFDEDIFGEDLSYLETEHDYSIKHVKRGFTSSKHLNCGIPFTPGNHRSMLFSDYRVLEATISGLIIQKLSRFSSSKRRGGRRL